MFIGLMVNDISKIWDSLAERFNTHKPLNEVHPDAVVNIEVGWPVLFQQINYQLQYLGKSKCRILDFGCGAGDLCKKFRMFGHIVVGMDHSDTMLKYARKNLPKDIELVLGNHKSPIFNSHKYKNKYDVVTAVHSLEWIEDIDAALSNLIKLLSPGGILLFAVFPEEHVVDSLKIKDLFENFDSKNEPKKGYANFDGIKVPVFVRNAEYFDKFFKKKKLQKVLESYPSYPKSFFSKYKWTGSHFPEMMILSYRKRK